MGPVIYSLHGAAFCIWASGWGVQGAVLGWQHHDNRLSPFFSCKSGAAWEAAIPGHLADIPGLNLLEQSLSLAVHCLNSSNLFRPRRGEKTQ